MHFEFIPGCGTTDAILILKQMQEKYSPKKRDLYCAVGDLESEGLRVNVKMKMISSSEKWGGFLCTHYRQSANLANVGYIRDLVICLGGRLNQDNEFKCWTYLI